MVNLRREGRPAPGVGRAAFLEEGQGVEDQDHGAVAHDRRPRDAEGPSRHRGVEGLDHDLLLAAEAIHGEAEATVSAPEDHGVGVAGRPGGCEVEGGREVEQRDDAVPDAQGIPAVHAHDLALTVLQALHHRAQGQSEGAARDLHEQGGDDGEGEGKLDDELGAHTRDALRFHEAVQPLDGLEHDVEPHSAARDVGHLGGGGEALREDELDGLPVAHLVVGVEDARAAPPPVAPGRGRCPVRRP